MVEVAGYELHEQIGSGGVGDVFRATQLSTGATVAVKLVRSVGDDEGTWRRIERELRALVELVGHANVVGVVQMVPTSAGRALVMEYASGGSLAGLVERNGPLPVESTVMVGRQIASAVAAAHERGIVHRDIKPQNVLVDGYGQAKLCDFGIASLLRSAELRQRASAVSMRYASPEDVEDEGDVVGPPSDVYSLGATMLFLRRGAPPTTIERISGWVPVTNPNEPEAAELDAIIADLLAVSPYNRPTMRVVYERLNELDRRLRQPADSLLGDDDELFPNAGSEDPDVLFPSFSAGGDSSVEVAADESGLPAPSVPVSPRQQRAGSRSIATPASAPENDGRPTPPAGPAASEPVRAEADDDGPSEAALTAAFGPVVDSGWLPTSVDQNNRFWEDDTVYRDDIPVVVPGVDDGDPSEDRPRRWPRALLLLVLVGASVGIGTWLLTGRSSGDPVANSTASTAPLSTAPTSAPPTSAPATTAPATTPTTTAAPTTAPPSTVPPTTIAPTTAAPTTPPTTAPRSVPTAPRPAGLVDLAAVPRPPVLPGGCLVQVEAELQPVDCDQAHDLQLIASVRAADGGGLAPTNESIQKTAQFLCASQFIELVHGNDGQAALQTVLKMDASAPDVAGWAGGDRTIECWVRLPGERLIGSAIGSGW